ncbi:MAG: IS630 transposase-related protein [Janthinobacterium lividum]
MSYGYSIDLRERVLLYIDAGHSQRQAGEVFNIPRQTIYNWQRLKGQTGGLKMRRSGHRRALKIEEDALRQAVENRPDDYLYELAKVFKVSPSGIYRALKRYKITRKKRRSFIQREMKSNVKSF